MNLRKLIFILTGLCALTLGTLGIFLPILPTVPLYLLTLILFAHSSERLRAWFVSSRLYRKYLLPYLKAGELTKPAKITLILFVTVQILIAAFLVRHSVTGLIICAALYLGFIGSMLFIVKTIDLPTQNEDEKHE